MGRIHFYIRTLSITKKTFFDKKTEMKHNVFINPYETRFFISDKNISEDIVA